jgi:uncharacterized membrane protein YeaQ/YmgE (transglycosylase-associated protein family)
MTITGILTAIVIGAIIGGLARLIIPGDQGISWWLTIIVGIIAALVGTVVARAFGWDHTAGVDWLELLTQLGFAVVFVGLIAGFGRRGP